MENNEILTPQDVKELTPLYEAVVLALKQVYDPEIPVNIYDLGLIYELNINKSHEVYIKMTFTAPNCPMADEVIAEVQHNVELTPGITKCSIELVFEPAWDQSLLSDEARIALGMDPELLQGFTFPSAPIWVTGKAISTRLFACSKMPWGRLRQPFPR